MLTLPGERGTAAVAGDLLHRATEVHVDVVDRNAIDQAVDQKTSGLADGIRVGSVELDRSRRFVGRKCCEFEALAVAFDERPRRDHLVHIQPSPKAPAQRAKRRIGDTGHRRENDGGPDVDRADVDRVELAGTSRWFGLRSRKGSGFEVGHEPRLTTPGRFAVVGDEVEQDANVIDRDGGVHKDQPEAVESCHRLVADNAEPSACIAALAAGATA